MFTPRSSFTTYSLCVLQRHTPCVHVPFFDHGVLLNIAELKLAYEEQVGYPTSDSTVLNLLTHHEWHKLMPRSFYPQRKCQTSKVHAVESILERLAALSDQVFICGV